MKNQTLKGIILVVLGAASYGVLTTFVKLAYQDGFTPFEVTFAQMLLGLVTLFIINTFYNQKKKKKQQVYAGKNIVKLILSGTSLGLTSIFYYLSVQYISVSAGIVLLMQSVWMGVLIESILLKKFPERVKIIAVILILLGTVLATNVLTENVALDILGVVYGLIAALSYAITIYASSQIATETPSITRSKYMLIGGFLIVAIVTLPSLVKSFDLGVFLLWGPILAFFGTILPPLLFTAGMPKINVGLGAILSAIELPVAVIMAYFLLQEKVSLIQWLGILMILFSIVLMNLKKVKP